MITRESKGGLNVSPSQFQCFVFQFETADLKPRGTHTIHAHNRQSEALQRSVLIAKTAGTLSGCESDIYTCRSFERRGQVDVRLTSLADLHRLNGEGGEIPKGSKRKPVPREMMRGKSVEVEV